MFKSAIQKVSKSIFPIFQNGPAGCKVLGTGFFIDNQGHFLTAAHVINALAAEIGESITLCGYPMPMIQLTEKIVDPVTKNTKVSLNVTAVRKYWQPTIKMDEFKPNFILKKKFRSFITQHAALPGMSGGPIFNQDSEVIGITSAVWPRKVPLDKSRSIDVSNGIGIELNEIHQFVKSALSEKTALT